MANQILAGAVFQASQVIAGVDADTILDTFIAASPATTSQEVIVRGQQHYNSDMGRVIVYSAVDNSIISTIDGTESGRKLGTQVLLTDDYILASTTKGVWDDDTTSSIHAYSTSDLTADPIIIGHPLGKGHREFGQAKGQLAAGNGKLFINEGNRLYICDLSNLSAAPVPFEFNSSDGGFDSTGNLNLAQAILVFNPYDNYLYVGQKNAYGGDGAITRLDTNTILTTGGSPETIYSVDAASISSMNFGRNIAIFEDCLYVSGKHAEGSPIQAVYKYNTSSFVSGHTAVPHLSKWSGSTQSLGSNDDFGSYIGSISASSKGTIIGAPNYGASDWNGGYVNTGRVYYIENYSNGTSGGLTQLNTSSMNLQHNEWAGENVYTDENYVYATFYGRSFSGANAVAVWSWDNISAAPTIIETESGNGIDIGSLVSREALPTFIAPSTTSSTVANKIFMWSSDAAAYQNGTGRSDVGGVVMTDGDFSNPTTIQLDSPQMVVGGEGKVVTISQLGEIKVYDESTGQLEQTFNDSYLDSAKANGPSAPWDSANDAVIGAGKIFISSPEQNPNGLGSIIAVDLLDRNVATYLITPTLGNYSRLSSPSWGGIRFIDGRIYGHTSQWSSDDQGIWHFAPDGSDEQFIPVPEMTSGSGFAKWGDNFVVTTGNTIEVIDSSGTTLHSVAKTYITQTRGFAKDLGVTSTGKLVVSNLVSTNPIEHSIFLYDEGLTNEIEFKPTDIANGIASQWGYGTVENSGSFEIFGEYILVSARETDYNGITNCGAVYRYNDSGVLQDIFYGTVADQKIGTNISVGTATTTTTLPAFIPPPAPASPYSQAAEGTWVVATAAMFGNNFNGQAFIMREGGNNITLSTPATGNMVGSAVAVSDDYVFVGNLHYDGFGDNAGAIFVFDKNTGSMVNTLQASTSTANTTFGDLDMEAKADSNRIATRMSKRAQIVGSPNESYGYGHIEIMDHDGSNRVHINHPDFDPNLGYANNIYFGRSSGWTTNKFVTSAYGADAGGNSSGSLLIYNPEDGSIATRIDGTQVNENFGNDIATQSNHTRILVGAKGWNNNAGRVILYEEDGTEVMTIERPSVRADAKFGNCVAYGSGRIVVSENLDTSVGRFFIFNEEDGSLINTITGPRNDNFASNSLDIAGNYIFASASGVNSNNGAFWVYDLDGNNGTRIDNIGTSGFAHFGAKLAASVE